MTRGVFLGLDYGRRRIGIAVSTPLGTVHSRPRLERTTLADDLAALKCLVDETGAGAVVLGLPHHMNGTTSAMEEEVRRFALALAKACGVPVYGTDERLTTEAAEMILRHREVRGRARRERRDSAAASLVLQDFLDAGEQGERIA
ncbi:MAG: Holliday junction resolvase RuvX [Planctomycetota bacterium]